jgi:hypothetical protein
MRWSVASWCSSLVVVLVACDRAGPAAPLLPLDRPGPAAPLPVTTAPLDALERAAPLALTASDGSGLTLTGLTGRATIEGPLAFTELRLDFHNPEDRVREGTFAITLPPGATIARFAMAIGDRWQEAEVVARPLARRAYDDFLHRRQDPALLEQAAGNQFTARVFPIPAAATKHLIVAFSQPLGDRPYTLPLRGLPAIGAVDVAVDVRGADGAVTHHRVRERAWRPDRDVVIAGGGAAAVAAGELVVATVAVPATALPPEPAPPQVLIAIDTSASRALGFAAQVGAAAALIDGLEARHGAALPLRVVAFDQEAQTIYRGPAAGFGGAQTAALVERGAAGASNLAPLVAALAGASPGGQLVLVTDGVWTAGPPLAETTAALGRLGLGRVDVVLTGGLRDASAAAAMTRAGTRAGDVHDLDDGIDAVLAGLGEPVAVDQAVAIAGARWVSPARLTVARPGRPVMIYARVADATRPLEITIGAVGQTVRPIAAPPALVERAVAGAELTDLEARLATAAPTEAEALRAAVIERSIAARVLSSQTSYLVLETEADYARYGIDRARRVVLTLDDAGLRAIQPTNPLPVAPPRPGQEVSLLTPLLEGHDDGVPTDAPPPIEVADDLAVDAPVADERAEPTVASRAPAPSDGSLGLGGGGSGWGTIGVGAAGTLGRGSAGGGTGYGVGAGRGGLRGRIARAPTVQIGRPTVVGELHRDIIRRYVRRAMPQLTYCYERALITDQRLRGAVSTRFTISPDGRVSGATAAGLTPDADACLVSVLVGLRFPAVPSGGVVQVTYPLAFHPAGTAPPDLATAPAATGPLIAPPPAPAPPDPDPVATALADGPPALTGTFAEIDRALAAGQVTRAVARARAWQARAPDDVLAWVALGRALEAHREPSQAARAYGSLIELFPGRADLRRHAAERLGHLAAGRDLAVDSLRRAVADRPDHLTGHRLLAYALVRTGDLAGAFDAIVAGVDQPRRDGRFAGGAQVLGEDAGLIGAAWLAAGGPRARVVDALTRRGLTLADGPSTRFVLSWETDGNDVDLHVRDRHGDHAYYSSPALPSGGALYADVTTGYGPECFTIPGAPKAGPYHLAAHYYARGPMGFGIGVLQVIRFDGRRLTLDDRPFVIMNDGAMVDLGQVR